MNRLFTLSFFLALILAGCSPQSPAADQTDPVQEDSSSDEAVPSPTQTALPPTAESTEEPEIAVVPGPFLEKFDSDLGNAWLWVNEDPSRWTLTEPGTLEILASDPSLSPESPSIEITNLLTRALPASVDVAITVKINANPDENFEQVGLYLLEDGDSYVTIYFGFCDTCAGRSVYVEAFDNGQDLLEEMRSFPVEDGVESLWLRLEYSPEANAIAALVALQEGDWQPVGTLVRNAPSVSTLALGAANLPGPGANLDEDFVAQFDLAELITYQ